MNGIKFTYFWSILGDKGHWKGPFHFIQAADTQLGLIDRYLLKSPVPNWDKELELTRAAVKKVNAMRPLPAFFIICGDLVDAYPGKEINGENMYHSHYFLSLT